MTPVHNMRNRVGPHRDGRHGTKAGADGNVMGAEHDHRAYFLTMASSVASRVAVKRG